MSAAAWFSWALIAAAGTLAYYRPRIVAWVHGRRNRDVVSAERFAAGCAALERAEAEALHTIGKGQQ